MWQALTRNIATTTAQFTNVNSHCLDHIVKLAETHEIVAEEDINDANGMKLWAKGAPISATLREKLLQRRLAQPLETALGVAGGATLPVVMSDAQELLESNQALDALGGSRSARALLSEAATLPLPAPVRLLLTMARQNSPECYRHSVAAVVACAGIAAKLNLGMHDALALLKAALLHDVGELYINPDYLRTRNSLKPTDWKNVAAHPCVGYAFIRELTTLPPIVAECILQHHERLDGSGYPFQLSNSEVSAQAGILAVADTVSAIALRGGHGLRKRIDIALRIVPGEFHREVVAAVLGALPAGDGESCDEPTAECVSHITPVQQQLIAVRDALPTLKSSGSQPLTSAGEYVEHIVQNIDKSLRTVGLADRDQLIGLDEDPIVVQEICLVVGEVSWRLRNLARNLYLRIDALGQPADLECAKPLIAALDMPID